MRARAALLLLGIASAAAADEVSDARQRWSASAYGPMLERILPPGFDPAMLPQPASAGARLTVRYCVQCHNLPNPAMHHPEKWAPVVDRMVVRMQGRGNMGRLMADMMAGVSAPTAEETRVLVGYLKAQGQKPLDPARLPEVNAASAEPFRLACQQCHVLPDPKRHTAKEWPAVVARMERNMEWMNRVVGSKPGQREPQLRVEAINAFLAKYARHP
jgi:hypothetical protein